MLSLASRSSARLTVFTIACASVPYLPEEDAKLRAVSKVTRRGGNGGNALQVLQQFASASELALHLISALPDRNSADTAKVLSSFGPASSAEGEAARRVDFSRCAYRDGEVEAPSSYILRSQATGSRTIVNHSKLADVTFEEFTTATDDFRAIDYDTWWHFEVGRSTSWWPYSTSLAGDTQPEWLLTRPR